MLTDSKGETKLIISVADPAELQKLTKALEFNSSLGGSEIAMMRVSLGGPGALQTVDVCFQSSSGFIELSD